MMNRWLSVGLSVAVLPVLFSGSVGAFSSTKGEPTEQSYALPVGVGSQPKLLAAKGLERRVALVIGNGNYSRNGWLKNPPNDAADIAKMLEQLGFEVTLKLDLNQEEMEEEVERFNRRLQQGGVGLFYYAGHAVQTGGENYLIPIGAKINRERDMRYKTVPLGQVLGAMEEAGNRLNIVILDACRDNPSLRQFSRNLTRGLAPIFSEPEGTIIAYATAPGDVAEDGEGRNSPYTASLLEHIAAPGVPLPLFFANVRRSVRQKTGGLQSPRYTSSVDGSFFFKPAASVTASRPAPQPSPAPVSSQTPEPSPRSPVSAPSPSPSEPVLISKATGVNYKRLHDLLRAGQWEDADQETKKLMRQAAGPNAQQRLSSVAEFEKFSCEDLRIVDQLWVNASDGKFGISVQNQIYWKLEVTRDYFDDSVWRKFEEQVGWDAGGNKAVGSELTPLNPLLPVGNLPTRLQGFYQRLVWWMVVVPRVEDCNL